MLDRFRDGLDDAACACYLCAAVNRTKGDDFANDGKSGQMKLGQAKGIQCDLERRESVLTTRKLSTPQLGRGKATPKRR